MSQEQTHIASRKRIIAAIGRSSQIAPMEAVAIIGALDMIKPTQEFTRRFGQHGRDVIEEFQRAGNEILLGNANKERK